MKGKKGKIEEKKSYLQHILYLSDFSFKIVFVLKNIH